MFISITDLSNDCLLQVLLMAGIGLVISLFPWRGEWSSRWNTVMAARFTGETRRPRLIPFLPKAIGAGSAAILLFTVNYCDAFCSRHWIAAGLFTVCMLSSGFS